MDKIRIFCFGFGQVAKSFIKKIISEKINIELSVTTRNSSTIKEMKSLKFYSYKFDNEKFDKALIERLKNSNYILVSVPPVNGEDVVIKNFETTLSKLKKCKWITYLSATSVYGDHKGEWVTENSETRPSSPNGIQRLNSEKMWKSFSEKSNLPLQIFRLAGIYSNEYNILKRLKIGSVQIVDKKDHFFSRVHVDDIANILLKSFKKFKRNEIYNICDDKPASQHEVALYGSKLLNIKEPKIVSLNQIESEMLRNFYKDSKKVNNKKMKNFFDYKLKFPTYVEGLDYIFNNSV